MLPRSSVRPMPELGDCSLWDRLAEMHWGIFRMPSSSKILLAPTKFRRPNGGVPVVMHGSCVVLETIPGISAMCDSGTGACSHQACERSTPRFQDGDSKGHRRDKWNRSLVFSNYLPRG